MLLFLIFSIIKQIHMTSDSDNKKKNISITINNTDISDKLIDIKERDPTDVNSLYSNLLLDNLSCTHKKRKADRIDEYFESVNCTKNNNVASEEIREYSTILEEKNEELIQYSKNLEKKLMQITNENDRMKQEIEKQAVEIMIIKELLKNQENINEIIKKDLKTHEKIKNDILIEKIEINKEYKNTKSILETQKKENNDLRVDLDCAHKDLEEMRIQKKTLKAQVNYYYESFDSVKKVLSIISIAIIEKIEEIKTLNSRTERLVNIYDQKTMLSPTQITQIIHKLKEIINATGLIHQNNLNTLDYKMKKLIAGIDIKLGLINLRQIESINEE